MVYGSFKKSPSVCLSVCIFFFFLHLLTNDYYIELALFKFRDFFIIDTEMIISNGLNGKNYLPKCFNFLLSFLDVSFHLKRLTGIVIFTIFCSVNII